MAAVGFFLYGNDGLESKGFAKMVIGKFDVLYTSPAETQLTQELDHLPFVQAWSSLHAKDRSA